MPLPTIADVFRVTLNWEVSSGPAPANVLHVRGAGDPNDVGVAFDFALATIADASHLYNCTAAVFAAPTIDILPLDGSSGTTTYTLDEAIEGGSGGSVIWQAAGVVTLQTGLSGPSHRGRQYVGPIGEDANLAGTLPSDSRGVMVTAWNLFLANMAVADMPLVVASYAHASAANVTAVRVNEYIGTQRRRARFLQS